MQHLMEIFDPYAETPQTFSSPALGIDLGTTHSVVGIIQEGHPRILTHEIEENTSLLPSVVAYEEQGQALVGKAAVAQLLGDPHSGIHAVKRLMTSQGSTPLTFRGTTKTPVEVSAAILKRLKGEAEKVLGVSPTQAVITVPAYFDDTARQATKDAAALAGLTVLRLINEPTAAALAYGLDQGVEGTYAVYDLGGGTFDLSLLRLSHGVFRVLATGGHTHLGGDDLDVAIAQFWDVPSPSFAILQCARAAKHHLSYNEAGTWLLPSGQHVHLTRTQVESLAQPFVDQTLTICKRVLSDATLSPTAIDGVILVGGATRMPLVRRAIRTFFGKEPLTNLNPDEIVALGATIQAQALTQGSDTLLLDVTPLSLGIETMGGFVEKIIPRNAPIPTSQSQVFTTYHDDQSTMKIHILQGEGEQINDCRSLGEFILSGIPPLPSGEARIAVTYTLDADGLLIVTAQEKTTGIRQTIEVKPVYGLGEEDMQALLRKAG